MILFDPFGYDFFNALQNVFLLLLIFISNGLNISVPSFVLIPIILSHSSFVFMPIY